MPNKNVKTGNIMQRFGLPGSYIKLNKHLHNLCKCLFN